MDRGSGDMRDAAQVCGLGSRWVEEPFHKPGQGPSEEGSVDKVDER